MNVLTQFPVYSSIAEQGGVGVLFSLRETCKMFHAALDFKSDKKLYGTTADRIGWNIQMGRDVFAQYYPWIEWMPKCTYYGPMRDYVLALEDVDAQAMFVVNLFFFNRQRCEEFVLWHGRAMGPAAIRACGLIQLRGGVLRNPEWFRRFKGCAPIKRQRLVF